MVRHSRLPPLAQEQCPEVAKVLFSKFQDPKILDSYDIFLAYVFTRLRTYKTAFSYVVDFVKASDVGTFFLYSVGISLRREGTLVPLRI